MLKSENAFQSATACYKKAVPLRAHAAHAAESKGSHNLDLNVVGGHTKPLSAQVSKEIAAAAITPTESII